MTQQPAPDDLRDNKNTCVWPVPHRLGLKALSSLTIDAQYAQHLGTKLFNSNDHQEGFDQGYTLLKDTVLDLQKTVSYLEGVLEGAKG